MLAEQPANYDKNVVDRRKKRRTTDVSRAVQRTRDRLVEQSGTVDFTPDLLQMHAHAIVAGAPAIPILVTIVAALGMIAGVRGDALIWATISATAYVVLALVARRLDMLEPEEVSPRIWSKRLLAAHGLTGVAWAYFAQMTCEACGISQIGVIQAVVLLIAMAATAIMSAALRGAVLAAFFLPVAVYTIFTANMLDPVQATMVGMLIAGLVFFSIVSSFLNGSARSALSFQSEKDNLIAALETAKAISDEARRRAEESNLAKSRFLASMSHELRTPLNAILGFSEVMANEVLGPLPNQTYKDYANDIHGSGQHLLDLINEILDLSRIEAGKHQLSEEQVNFTHIADDCIHMMQLKAKNKNIKIVQLFEPVLPPLWADEKALRQIILNLLSNAVKFTPTGGEIKVKLGWTAGGGQYLAVADNGPGIPEEEIPIVLSAFGQGSIAIKSAEQGTGLGLPIVQALVHMHGGKFELTSKLRSGTQATATFPSSRVMDVMPAVEISKQQLPAHNAA
jgi:two-component system, cell cycle sensor histidine kinase PleC